MSTPWTAYGVVVDAHRRDLIESTPTPRRARQHRVTARTSARTFRRHAAARPAAC